MRIENNNNVGFGAYFKNNQEFKRMMSYSAMHKKDLMDKFIYEMPAHEIEILELSKDTVGYMGYVLHNNSTKQFVELDGVCPISSLNDIIKKITDPICSYFWVKDKATENYLRLTGNQ